jgi:hypothetical protein
MRTPQMLRAVRRSAPTLADAAFGVVVGVLLLAAGWIGVGPPWDIHPHPIGAGAGGLIGLVTLAVAVRRRYPVSVLLTLDSIALLWSAAHFPGVLVPLASLIACYTVATLRGWRWGLAGSGLSASSVLVAVHLAFGAEAPAGLSGTAVWMIATAGAAGTAVGYYRALLGATRAQLAREAQTHEEQARHRLIEERLRIARELHDILGHTMASISVQAGAGLHLLATRPAQAAEALTTIKHVSDQGLTDVKTMLGVLRADDETDQPRAPARRPRPTRHPAAPRADGGDRPQAQRPRQRAGTAGSDRPGRLPDHSRGAHQRVAPRARPHRRARPALRTFAGRDPGSRRRAGGRPGRYGP